MLSYLKLYRINSLLTVIQSRLRHGPLGSCLGIYFPWNLARIKSFVFQPTSTLFLGKVSQMIIDGSWMLNVFIFPFLFSELILNLIASVVAMFYYPNPLLVPGGSVRFPSLELPFSSNQPCKFARSSKSSTETDLTVLQTPPSATPRMCTTRPSWGGSRGGTGRHSPSNSSRSWRQSSTRLTTQMSSPGRSWPVK